MELFVREKEYKQIQEMLTSSRSEALLMYGRRRVGKSFLLNYILDQQNCTVIRYICMDTTLQQNLEGLTEAVKQAFHEEYLSFNSLSDLLKYLYQKAQREKIIFFLDEYPCLRGNKSEIDSCFQIAIDRYSASSNLKLILCGSYTGIMKKVFGANEENAPLRGRFRYIILLKPLDYYDASLFYPNYSYEEKIAAYACFGGVPFYLSMINEQQSVRENLIRLILPADSILENEIKLTLTYELSKPENANAILSLIADGVKKYSDLNSRLSTPSNNGLLYTLIISWKWI